ncbi:MAG: hypothetical protein GXO63_03085 [Candidatus Micrarchaeota archaeon]|nr:hypothetical protein [Candidatus Micrarchaeota archaeon]
MKAQVHVVTLTLLFLIGLVLLLIAFFWGEPILRGNVEEARISAATVFLKRLDTTIRDVLRSGGEETISFDIAGTIMIGEDNKKIVLLLPASEFPENWLYIRNTSSVIRGKKDERGVIFELFYRYPELVFVPKDRLAISSGTIILKKLNATALEVDLND